jgi:hypothetical protein
MPGEKVNSSRGMKGQQQQQQLLQRASLIMTAEEERVGGPGGGGEQGLVRGHDLRYIPQVRD